MLMRNNYSEQVPVRQQRGGRQNSERMTTPFRIGDNTNRELYIQVNCSHQVDDNKTYCAVSRAQTPCFGAKGSIKADIHESSVGASAPHRGTISRWRIHECKSGRSQCWCTGSPACASKAANQCRSCHDFASERSQVVTVCVLSSFTPRYVGVLWQVSRLPLMSTLSSRFASRLFR